MSSCHCNHDGQEGSQCGGPSPEDQRLNEQIKRIKIIKFISLFRKKIIVRSIKPLGLDAPFRILKVQYSRENYSSKLNSTI